MTTITIKQGLPENDLVVSNPQEAVEALIESMGYVLLTPIEDLSIQKRIQEHAEKNKNRSLDTYDDI